MNSLQETDDKHLIIEDQFGREANAKHSLLHSDRQHSFWGKRYLCIHGIHDKKFWRFDIFDLLTNDSKSMRFQKSPGQFQVIDTYFLNYKFMLIVESEGLANLYRVTLVELNWESGYFEASEHFERRVGIMSIIADPLNQSKFVLSFATLLYPIEYHECKLVKGKIEFGNVNQLSGDYDQCLNDKLIKVDRLGRKLRVKTYSMIDKQEKTFETGVCPAHVELLDGFLFKWIIDRLYVAICFQDSDRHGLMCTDAKTRRWNILDFSTTIVIRDLHFFDGSLIIRTKQVGTENGVFKSSVKVYEIAIHRPQSLRQKAWLRVIRNLKAKGTLNPYKEAARYLPFNSDLRPHWFEDVEEEAPEKQDNDKSNSTGTNGESETIQGAKSDQCENNDGEEALKKQSNDGEE